MVDGLVASYPPPFDGGGNVDLPGAPLIGLFDAAAMIGPVLPGGQALYWRLNPPQDGVIRIAVTSESGLSSITTYGDNGWWDGVFGKDFTVEVVAGQPLYIAVTGTIGELINVLTSDYATVIPEEIQPAQTVEEEVFPSRNYLGNQRAFVTAYSAEPSGTALRRELDHALKTDHWNYVGSTPDFFGGTRGFLGLDPDDPTDTPTGSIFGPPYSRRPLGETIPAVGDGDVFFKRDNDSSSVGVRTRPRNVMTHELPPFEGSSAPLWGEEGIFPVTTDMYYLWANQVSVRFAGVSLSLTGGLDEIITNHTPGLGELLGTPVVEKAWIQVTAEEGEANFTGLDPTSSFIETKLFGRIASFDDGELAPMTSLAQRGTELGTFGLVGDTDWIEFPSSLLPAILTEEEGDTTKARLTVLAEPAMLEDTSPPPVTDVQQIVFFTLKLRVALPPYVTDAYGWPDLAPEALLFSATRLYPRDDTGGFNGSPRIFPSPKGAGRRIFGGFMRSALNAVNPLVGFDALLSSLTDP